MAGDGNLITLRREWTRAGGSRSRHLPPGICRRSHAGLYHLRNRHSGPWVLDSRGSAGKTPLAPPRHLQPTNRSPLCPFLPTSSAQPRVGVSLGWVTRPRARAWFPESTWPAGPPQRPALGYPGCGQRFQNHLEQDAHCAPYGQCHGLWSLPGPVLEQTRAEVGAGGPVSSRMSQGGPLGQWSKGGGEGNIATSPCWAPLLGIQLPFLVGRYKDGPCDTVQADAD